ncbi:hypothetical protein D3261_13990 [Halococcus sp. IIIV-5B]|nr:hypothetical protein D3261_13990 [Halococcus sp. IIIV-5B]
MPSPSVSGSALPFRLLSVLASLFQLVSVWVSALPFRSVWVSVFRSVSAFRWGLALPSQLGSPLESTSP